MRGPETLPPPMPSALFASSSFNLSKDDPVVTWLLDGDPAIAFQVHRDLFEEDRLDLQKRIPLEGWGKAYLEARHIDGSWGNGFYKPYWTASHYTLLDLKSFAFPPDHPAIAESLDLILRRPRARDGGITASPGDKKSDVCINALFLSYAAYFGVTAKRLEPVVDFLLGERMQDGGFNCMRNRSGARVSSLHSTLSVIEGLSGFLAQRHSYRAEEIRDSLRTARETLLARRLFRSRRSGDIIRADFLKPTFPARWRYTTLRALDTFRADGTPFDPRMQEALTRLAGLRRKDGRWLRSAALPGKTHLELEPPRQPSRWITLIALRILKAYGHAPEKDKTS